MLIREWKKKNGVEKRHSDTNSNTNLIQHLLIIIYDNEIWNFCFFWKIVLMKLV